MKLLLFLSIDGRLLGKHREEQIAMGSKGAEQRRLGPGIGGQWENVVVNSVLLLEMYLQSIENFLLKLLILLEFPVIFLVKFSGKPFGQNALSAPIHYEKSTDVVSAQLNICFFHSDLFMILYGTVF